MRLFLCTLILLSFGWIANQQYTTEEEPTFCTECYEVRTGYVTSPDQVSGQIIVQTIDKGRNWLLITPTKEVIGYLHKRLPNVEPDSLKKISPTDADVFNNNSNFYYDWL